MPCLHVSTPVGPAIACTGRAKRCKCGRRGTLLCDWKIPAKRSGTCNAALCEACASSPAADKHLCPMHTAALAEWAEDKRNGRAQA